MEKKIGFCALTTLTDIVGHENGCRSSFNTNRSYQRLTRHGYNSGRQSDHA